MTKPSILPRPLPTSLANLSTRLAAVGLALVVLSSCKHPPSEDPDAAVATTDGGADLAGDPADLAGLDLAGLDLASSPDLGPALSTFVTYLGGGGFEQARDVAVDAQGNIIVVGGTQSANFPVTAGSYDTSFDQSGTGMLGSAGAMDVFVTKLSPTGQILWSTFIGGPSYDRAYAVEVDAAGDIVIAGRAGVGFPTTAGALQPTFAGDVQINPPYGPQDGFVAKLSADGTQLLFSTYFGSDGREIIRDMDLDATGIYIGVGEMSRDNPHVTAGAYDTTRNAGTDNLVAKLALDGSAVLWATYFGGNGDESIPSLRVGAGGHVFLIGDTQSTDLPTTAGAFQTTKKAGRDFFVAKLAPGGDALVWCTYLGGDANESHETHHGVVDAAGQVLLGFNTASSNMPTTAGAYRATRLGTADAYVARLSADGKTLLAATYLGGSGGEDVQGLATDSAGNVYVGGSSSSLDLPTTAGARQASAGGGGDAWVAWLSPSLGAIQHLTYLGGSADDRQRSLWIDAAGNAITVGQTTSTNLPTTPGAAQSTYGGGSADALVGAYKLH